MLRLRTLTQQFGSLYSFVIAIMVGVCVVVIVQLRQMRTDSDRVMEEAREQMVPTRIWGELQSLRNLLIRPETVDVAEIQHARELLRRAAEDLGAVADHPDDPSSEEHEIAEARVREPLRQDLMEIDKLLGEVPGDESQGHALDVLVAANGHLRDLLAENQEEAKEASSDLERRARATRAIMLATLLFATVLLGVALALLQRKTVKPIRRLRAGAERFGRGDLKFRIDSEGTEEIADLANSFNTMADSIADSQEHLEERVRARTQEFLRAARLADLGLLASGIAHEINTPLASIASCAEGLQRRLEKGDASSELLNEYAETIAGETFRARDITTRMLALVRQEPNKVSKVSLRLVLEQAASALRHRAEQRGVRLVCEPLTEDTNLLVNGGELVQIVLNLLTNAVDSSAKGGQVTLRSEVSADTLQLVVADEGEGIPEEDLERIFEPFFTTKRPGQGTGLGLALVGTMVENHRGSVAVESEPGRGSVFKVTLPRDWSATQ